MFSRLVSSTERYFQLYIISCITDFFLASVTFICNHFTFLWPLLSFFIELFVTNKWCLNLAVFFVLYSNQSFFSARVFCSVWAPLIFSVNFLKCLYRMIYYRSSISVYSKKYNICLGRILDPFKSWCLLFKKQFYFWIFGRPFWKSCR